MKKPSFQFYPADWRNNAKLRRCTWEARGAWLEVMCLLHDSEEYGLLRWSLKELAQAIGAPIKLLKELADKDVLKGGDKTHEILIYTPRSGRVDGDPVTLIKGGQGACWYSSRMVIDEHIRQKKGESTRFPSSPNPSPKGGIGEDIGASPSRSPKPYQSDGSTSSSSSTLIQIPSVDKSTDGKPSDLPTARDLIFSNGVPLLIAAAVPEKNARSMLAGLCKQNGDDAVLKAIQDCAVERPVQPVSWLQAVLKPKGQGKHSGFQNKNYREGVEADGTFA